MVPLHNGLGNPQFACLEINYGEPDEADAPVVTGKNKKNLVIYEVDLGLNHVIRKSAEAVPDTAHALIAVPGGDENQGPGGVLVACENFLIYKKEKQQDRKCSLPIRLDQSKASGVFVTNSQTLFSQDLGVMTFIQTEHGDLFRVDLDQNGGEVLGIRISYFDTISPCSSLLLLESGYLFAAADGADHSIYRFLSLGSEANKKFTSDSLKHFDESSVAVEHSKLVKFCPSRQLQNLEECDKLPNLASINDMLISDLAGIGEKQIYLACGKSNRGTLRQLTRGLSVLEMATSSLPLKPERVISLRSPFKAETESKFDDFLLVSFAESTLVLAIRDGKISTAQDTGFQKSEPTLHAGVLADGSFIQVTPTEIVHVRQHLTANGLPMKNTAWKCDHGRQIKQACSNQT